MKKIVLLLVIGMMSLSLVACGDNTSENDFDKLSENSVPDSDNASENEFDKLIENFVPDRFNTFIMKVGQVHKPGAAVWLSSGSGTVYSSDENVVTIGEYGKVTAVGKGTAYVVIVGQTGMSKVYQYTVI